MRACNEAYSLTRGSARATKALSLFTVCSCAQPRTRSKHCRVLFTCCDGTPVLLTPVLPTQTSNYEVARPEPSSRSARSSRKLRNRHTYFEKLSPGATMFDIPASIAFGKSSPAKRPWTIRWLKRGTNASVQGKNNGKPFPRSRNAKRSACKANFRSSARGEAQPSK